MMPKTFTWVGAGGGGVSSGCRCLSDGLRLAGALVRLGLCLGSTDLLVLDVLLRLVQNALLHEHEDHNEEEEAEDDAQNGDGHRGDAVRRADGTLVARRGVDPLPAHLARLLRVGQGRQPRVVTVLVRRVAHQAAHQTLARLLHLLVHHTQREAGVVRPARARHLQVLALRDAQRVLDVVVPPVLAVRRDEVLAGARTAGGRLAAVERRRAHLTDVSGLARGVVRARLAEHGLTDAEAGHGVHRQRPLAEHGVAHDVRVARGDREHVQAASGDRTLPDVTGGEADLVGLRSPVAPEAGAAAGVRRAHVAVAALVVARVGRALAHALHLEVVRGLAGRQAVLVVLALGHVARDRVPRTALELLALLDLAADALRRVVDERRRRPVLLRHGAVQQLILGLARVRRRAHARPVVAVRHRARLVLLGVAEAQLVGVVHRHAAEAGLAGVVLREEGGTRARLALRHRLEAPTPLHAAALVRLLKAHAGLAVIMLVAHRVVLKALAAHGRRALRAVQAELGVVTLLAEPVRLELVGAELAVQADLVRVGAARLTLVARGEAVAGAVGRHGAGGAGRQQRDACDTHFCCPGRGDGLGGGSVGNTNEVQIL
eukprot:Rhum_TRINITY_DN14345_c25_g1::Rhum_TRINITY_DN14345_c25_g1_i1::g.84902::m.84902